MTNKEITMIENSWDYIILNVEEAGELFYSRLFEIDPGLRALFKSDVRAQSGKLTSMITFLVQKLNSLDEIKKDIQDYKSLINIVYRYGFNVEIIDLMITKSGELRNKHAGQRNEIRELRT